MIMGTKYGSWEMHMMFVIEGMDKVREVIEKNRKRKLAKHKKLSNNRIIEIDNCSPLEIRKLQNKLTMIADNEGIFRSLKNIRMLSGVFWKK